MWGVCAKIWGKLPYKKTYCNFILAQMNTWAIIQMNVCSPLQWTEHTFKQTSVRSKPHFPTLSFYHHVQFLSMWLFTKILENNSMFFVYFNYWQRISSRNIAQKTGCYFMHFYLFLKSQLWKMYKRDNEKNIFFVHFTYWQIQPRYVIIFQIFAGLVGTNLG